MTAAIEELLQLAFDRLSRQEQRTDALEAAVLGAGAAPTVRDTVTPVVPWPPARRPEAEPPAPSAAEVIDALDDVVWSVSPDGRQVLFAGGGVEPLYGLAAHDLRSRPGRWLDAVWPDDRPAFAAALARLPDTGKFRLEHRVARADGSARWAVTRGALARDADGRPVRVDGTTADVTAAALGLAAAEERAAAAEAAVRASANLASAGRLAAGVAHDFHNLLGVIAGNADLLREGLPDGDPRREYADAASRTAHTVAALSRQLVEIGRPSARAPAPVDASAAVRALEPVLRRLTGRHLPLALDLGSGLPLVRIDPTDFDRVVLNLVLNARDASRPGSAIAVRAAAAAVEPGRPGWPPDLPPGAYVALTVADQGCGMSPEVRARMFDSFFTTKGAAGSGLGLATVRDAVRAAGGHVEVESEPHWGTTVRVYWPPL